MHTIFLKRSVAIFLPIFWALSSIGHAENRISRPLTVISTDTFSTLDPHVAYDWITYMSLNAVCANLTALDDSLAVIYDLAQDIEYQNGGSSIIFQLDPNRKFHNGQEVRAKDVVYSLNRMLSSEVASPGAGMFDAIVGFDDYAAGITDQISGVKALSDLSLRIDLERPAHSFPYILATNFGCIIPEGFNQKPFDLPISAGPLKVESYEENGTFTLSRFKTDTPVYEFEHDGMIIRSQLEISEVVALYSTGHVDVVLDGLAWAALSGQNSVLTVEKDDPGISPALTYMALNTRLPPFDNVNVRRAVNFAIDREKLSSVLKKAGQATSQIIPPAFEEYDESIPQNIYDPKYAAELLKGMDLPIHVELYAIDQSQYRDVVYSIAEDLRQIGFVVTPKYGTHQQVEAVAVNPKKGQMIFSDGLGWFPDYFDVSNFYFPLLSPNTIGNGGWNWSAYSNSEVDGLALQADMLVNKDQSQERKKLWQQAFGLINNDAPMIALYNRTDWMYWTPLPEGETTPLNNHISLKKYVRRDK